MASSSVLSTKLICEVSTSEHSHHLRHLRETLPEGDRLCADGGRTIDHGVCHLLDESWQWDDVTGHLLLELYRSSAKRSSCNKDIGSYAVVQCRPVQNHAEQHGLPEDLGGLPSSQCCDGV